jgi:hypothetical protein
MQIARVMECWSKSRLKKQAAISTKLARDSRHCFCGLINRRTYSEQLFGNLQNYQLAAPTTRDNHRVKPQETVYRDENTWNGPSCFLVSRRMTCIFWNRRLNSVIDLKFHELAPDQAPIPRTFYQLAKSARKGRKLLCQKLFKLWLAESLCVQLSELIRKAIWKFAKLFCRRSHVCECKCTWEYGTWRTRSKKCLKNVAIGPNFRLYCIPWSNESNSLISRKWMEFLKGLWVQNIRLWSITQIPSVDSPRKFQHAISFMVETRRKFAFLWGLYSWSPMNFHWSRAVVILMLVQNFN